MKYFQKTKDDIETFRIIREEEQRPEQKQPEKYKTEILNQLHKRLPEIDFGAGMEICGGDEEFYLEILQDFIQSSIKDELMNLYQEGNYKNYCIRVHGLKNSAYSVGAKAIGDLAYEMEKLTKEALPEETIVMQARLFELFDGICQAYKNVVQG